jgi:hypothetical protein
MHLPPGKARRCLYSQDPNGMQLLNYVTHSLVFTLSGTGSLQILIDALLSSNDTQVR